MDLRSHKKTVQAVPGSLVFYWRMMLAIPSLLKLAYRHAAVWGDVPLAAVPGGERELDRIKDKVLR